MKLEKIEEIAKKAGISEKYLEPYGKYKAKIDLSILDTLKERKGKLVLVTAITPTKFGEGKTTVSIALNEGLRRRKVPSLLCLREPSLGPVFGLKGGATGGGKVTVEPSEEINLHFTGDMHALTSSINLISAVLDNSIYQGNELHIDPNKVVWKRAMDMNDRTLRDIQIGRGKSNGVERNDGFVITVASELMAVLCLAKDENDFIERVKRITVAYTFENKRITVGDLKIAAAIRKLMKEAIKPNIVQTQEQNPCLIHGGPFANIAHGCNSLIALDLALRLSPVVVTEAGFGSDLGAEKFLDILSVEGNLHPDLVVMVATIKALKWHGGSEADSLHEKNLDTLKEGMANLQRHLENMKLYGLNPVVALNHFAEDDGEELDYVLQWAKEKGYPICLCDGYLKGGAGAEKLAQMVMEILNNKESSYHPIYSKKLSIQEKIETIAKNIYHAKDVEYSPLAMEKIKEYTSEGFQESYVCMAKTPESFSDNAKLKNAPSDFTLHVRDVSLSSGADFIVVYTGKIMTMPGLPKIPAAVKMEDE